MKTKPRYCTVAQVANLLCCQPQAINSAIERGKLTACYPFPDDFKSPTSGPKFVVVDSLLRAYVVLNRGKAAIARGNHGYNPVTVLEKYCDYADTGEVVG